MFLHSGCAHMSELKMLALFLAVMPFAAAMAKEFGPKEQSIFWRQSYLKHIAGFAKDYYVYNKDNLIVHFTNITTTDLELPIMADSVDSDPEMPYDIYSFAAFGSIFKFECEYDFWHGTNHTAGRFFGAAPSALFDVDAAIGDHSQFFNVGWSIMFIPLNFNVTNFDLGPAEYENLLTVVIENMMFAIYLDETVIDLTVSDFVDQLNKYPPSGRILAADFGREQLQLADKRFAGVEIVLKPNQRRVKRNFKVA